MKESIVAVSILVTSLSSFASQPQVTQAFIQDINKQLKAQPDEDLGDGLTSLGMQMSFLPSLAMVVLGYAYHLDSTESDWDWAYDADIQIERQLQSVCRASEVAKTYPDLFGNVEKIRVTSTYTFNGGGFTQFNTMCN